MAAIVLWSMITLVKGQWMARICIILLVGTRSFGWLGVSQAYTIHPSIHTPITINAPSQTTHTYLHALPCSPTYTHCHVEPHICTQKWHPYPTHAPLKQQQQQRDAPGMMPQHMTHASLGTATLSSTKTSLKRSADDLAAQDSSKSIKAEVGGNTYMLLYKIPVCCQTLS